MPQPQRLDAALVERGLCASRTLARKAIEAGRVRLRRAAHPDSVVASKPASPVDDTDELFLTPADEDRYVSRGALKLKGALEQTGLSPAGLTCLDVGQSTGGFTDLLLQSGAKRVLGVDVGHGQLHASLKDNPAVRCVEHFNARDICRERLEAALASQSGEIAVAGAVTEQTGTALSAWLPPEGYDLIVMDVSFISMLKITPGLRSLMKSDTQGIWLVKPQFEVGPALIGKGGLVKPEALGPAFETHIRQSLSAQGFAVKQFMTSPIEGGDGNTEYFVWVSPER